MFVDISHYRKIVEVGRQGIMPEILELNNKDLFYETHFMC